MSADWTIYPLAHALLRTALPRCLWRGSPAEPEIALTFDDGPHPEHTPALLAALERYGILATFFWLGRSVRQAPAVARMVAAQGHRIGLHGDSHLPWLSTLGLAEELARVRSIIAEATGISPATLIDVRPPFGLCPPPVLDWLLEQGFRPVMWQVVPEDWKVPPEVSIRRVLAQATSGALVVLHEDAFAAPHAAGIVEAIVPRLRKRGFRFVTVDRFWSQIR